MLGLFFTTVLSLRNIAGANNQTKIIGYFEPKTDGLQFGDLDASTLTHLIYAFASLTIDGEATWEGSGSGADAYSFWAQDRRMEKYERYCGCQGTCLKGYLNQLFKFKREHPHIRTIMSLGGFSWSANFSAVMKNPTTRQYAVETSTELMLQYGFDGIDIDWEFPTNKDRPVTEKDYTTDPNDWTNYALFMNEMRNYWKSKGIPDDAILSIAAPGYLDSDTLFESAMQSLAKSLTFVLVASYEYQHNPSIAKLGSQLYSHSGDSQSELETTVDKAMSGFSKYFGKSQLIMGIPVYASGFDGITPNTGKRDMICLGDSIQSGSEAKKISYREAMRRSSPGGDFRGYQVSFSRAQAVMCNDDIFYSFDSVETVAKKAEYVIKNGLGGIMVWDLSQDVNPKTSPQYSLAVAAKKALNYSPVEDRQFSDFCSDSSKFCNLRCSYTPEIALAYEKKNSGNTKTVSLLLLLFTLFQ